MTKSVNLQKGYKSLSQIDSEVKVCFVTAFEEYYIEFKSEFLDLDEL
jgi:hypothetical protein